jgi:hypothetical protein
VGDLEVARNDGIGVEHDGAVMPPWHCKLKAPYEFWPKSDINGRFLGLPASHPCPNPTLGQRDYQGLRFSLALREFPLT